MSHMAVQVHASSVAFNDGELYLHAGGDLFRRKQARKGADYLRVKGCVVDASPNCLFGCIRQCTKQTHGVCYWCELQQHQERKHDAGYVKAVPNCRVAQSCLLLLVVVPDVFEDA